VPCSLRFAHAASFADSGQQVRAQIACWADLSSSPHHVTSLTSTGQAPQKRQARRNGRADRPKGRAPVKGRLADAAEADLIRAEAAGATEKGAQKALPQDVLLATSHLTAASWVPHGGRSLVRCNARRNARAPRTPTHSGCHLIHAADGACSGGRPEGVSDGRHDPNESVC